MDIKAETLNYFVENGVEYLVDIKDPGYCGCSGCCKGYFNYILRNVLHLSDAQLAELQKEGAKLVVQCAGQMVPDIPNDIVFYDGVYASTLTQKEMLRAGFVKVVGG
jgi:hypothetical protein